MCNIFGERHIHHTLQPRFLAQLGTPPLTASAGPMGPDFEMHGVIRWWRLRNLLKIGEPWLPFGWWLSEKVNNTDENDGWYGFECNSSGYVQIFQIFITTIHCYDAMFVRLFGPASVWPCFFSTWLCPVDHDQNTLGPCLGQITSNNFRHRWIGLYLPSGYLT